MPENKEVLTRKELAKHFKVSPETVTAWSKVGMPCIFIGRVQTHEKGARPRYFLKDCEKWLRNRTRI